MSDTPHRRCSCTLPLENFKCDDFLFYDILMRTLLICIPQAEEREALFPGLCLYDNARCDNTPRQLLKTKIRQLLTYLYKRPLFRELPAHHSYASCYLEEIFNPRLQKLFPGFPLVQIAKEFRERATVTFSYAKGQVLEGSRNFGNRLKTERISAKQRVFELCVKKEHFATFRLAKSVMARSAQLRLLKYFEKIGVSPDYQCALCLRSFKNEPSADKVVGLVCKHEFDLTCFKAFTVFNSLAPWRHGAVSWVPCPVLDCPSFLNPQEMIELMRKRQEDNKWKIEKMEKRKRAALQQHQQQLQHTTTPLMLRSPPPLHEEEELKEEEKEQDE